MPDVRPRLPVTSLELAQQDPVILLAINCWMEARGETPEGILAVARVVRNRVERAIDFLAKKGKPHPLNGDGTYSSAILAKAQFSWTLESDPQNRWWLEIPRRGGWGAWRKCLEAAIAVYYGLDDTALPHPNAFPATHYFTQARPAWAKRWPPPWAEKMAKIGAVGAHVFYEEKV